MRWECRLYFRDRDGNRRSVSSWIANATTIAELVAFANGFGDAVSAISNGQLVGATLTNRRQVGVSTVAQVGSDVGRKMVLILKNSTTYGTIVIPSPGPLPFDLADPVNGFRIRKGYWPESDPIPTLIAGLNQLVTPTGEPMPTEDWMLALLSD